MVVRQREEMDDPALTTGAAARLLGVATSTVQLWLGAGTLPSWATPGGHRRVRRSAVLQLLAQRSAGRSHGAGRTDNAPALGAEFFPLAMPPYPVPSSEAARLRAVGALRLVDTPPEHVFDRLTGLAAQVTDCPIALITLLTARRQWFKSRRGMDLPETPRAWAFCSHAILQEMPLTVEDATVDPRFARNPLVTGVSHVRFYAGVALVDAGGHRLGTLCVLDREPRRLRQRELGALIELAGIASEELRRRA